jgi:hypothetical protein
MPVFFLIFPIILGIIFGPALLFGDRNSNGERVCGALGCFICFASIVWLSIAFNCPERIRGSYESSITEVKEGEVTKQVGIFNGETLDITKNTGRIYPVGSRIRRNETETVYAGLDFCEKKYSYEIVNP